LMSQIYQKSNPTRSKPLPNLNRSLNPLLSWLVTNKRLNTILKSLRKKEKISMMLLRTSGKKYGHK